MNTIYVVNDCGRLYLPFEFLKTNPIIKLDVYS